MEDYERCWIKTLHYLSKFYKSWLIFYSNRFRCESYKINGVSRKINTAVSKASDFAVKAALEDQLTAGLAAAINSAVAATVSGDRLAFSLTHEVESTILVPG